MSDTNPNGAPGSDTGDGRAQTVAEDHGFDQEPSGSAQSTSSAGASRARFDADVRRRNLRATFGTGPGKLALIAIAVVVVVFSALALGNLRGAPTVASKAQVDAPTTPQNRVTTNAVTSEEAARRAEQSRREAEEAQAKGRSYQPGFDYNIAATNPQTAPPPTAQFSGFETPTEAAERAQGTSGNARTLAQPGAAAGIGGAQQQQVEQQRREQEMQRAADKLATDQKTAETERDKYVDSISQEIVKQIGGMFSSQGSESLNSLGSYSQATYYNPPARNTDATARAVDAFQAMATRRPAIKAGSTMYATLDSEANTDDGRTVLATVRSGQWKGAKLIGSIEQANNNIALSFATMAPQDDRPTMRIRAVALREADAKLGMAETINHHTLSRYTSLGAAALLQGAGRVYQQPIGTTVVTNGGIVTTTEEPRGRQVAGSAIGEVGVAIGGEIRRRGFNQPSTYSTPAETGFVLYFLEDVVANSATNDGQQRQQQLQQQLQPQQLQSVPQLQQANAFGNPALPGGFDAASNAPSALPQGGFNPGYGATPYGYGPGSYGTTPYQLPGYGNRYVDPLNSNR